MIKEEIKLDINTCKHFDREVGCEKEVCVCEQQDPKQEKVRESAGRILREKYPYHPPQDYGYWVDMFVEGAEWQEKEMYSKEHLKEAYFSAIKITGEGWNGEYAGGNHPDIEEKFMEGFNEWFKQFKKK